MQIFAYRHIWIRDHSSSTSTKCSKKTNISYSLIRTCECQRAGNVGFSENFAYVLNEKIRNLTYHLTTSNFEDCMTAHLIKVRDHPFSTYETFSKNYYFLPLISTRTYGFYGVINVSFPERFAYALNEWSLINKNHIRSLTLINS